VPHSGRLEKPEESPKKSPKKVSQKSLAFFCGLDIMSLTIMIINKEFEIEKYVTARRSSQ
jgi:hypothetical protein